MAALPADVLCLGSAWSVHAYARYGTPTPAAADPVAALEDALRAARRLRRGRAGVDHRGRARGRRTRAPRAASRPHSSSKACRALAAQLQRWFADPRVAAVFQYSFRDDPAFPVGLASADLRALHPVYGLWLSLARARAGAGAPVGRRRAQRLLRRRV